MRKNVKVGLIGETSTYRQLISDLVSVEMHKDDAGEWSNSKAFIMSLVRDFGGGRVFIGVWPESTPDRPEFPSAPLIACHLVWEDVRNGAFIGTGGEVRQPRGGLTLTVDQGLKLDLEKPPKPEFRALEVDL